MITELKNSAEGFYSRVDEMEERINELEDRAIEFFQSEAKKKKE